MMGGIVEVVTMGVGATLCIDAWAWFLRRAFGVRSLDFCLLGRWVLHMPGGRFMHDNITTVAAKPRECLVGWMAHYSIGISFAFVFIALAPSWLARPTLLPALAFGIATVVVPFTTVQPAFGLGLASSRVTHPARAQMKSVMTHAVYGAGLFLVRSVEMIVM